MNKKQLDIEAYAKERGRLEVASKIQNIIDSLRDVRELVPSIDDAAIVEVVHSYCVKVNSDAFNNLQDRK